MWSLIVNKYNLIGEFQKLKDMFLIGRGELFSLFLESATNLLNKPVDQSLEYSKPFISPIGVYFWPNKL